MTRPSLKQRILHGVGAIAALATIAAGALPQLVPLAALLHVAPQVLTGIGTVLAFVANIPTILGIKPAVSPTSSGSTVTTEVTVESSLPPMKPTTPPKEG